MPITGQVHALVNKFESDNPKAGKAALTSGDRTPAEQLAIILDPKRKNNYLNIKKRFLAAFKLKEMPLYNDLKPDQTKWWISEIMKQAGKPKGFAHVGGKAQDVSLKKLDEEARQKLKELLEAGGFGVMNEHVTDSASDYNVSIEKAAVFHVYKK